MADELEIYVHELPLLWRGVIAALASGALLAIVLAFGLVKLSQPVEIAQAFILVIVAAVVLLVGLTTWVDERHSSHVFGRSLFRFAQKHGFSLVERPSDDARAEISGPFGRFVFHAVLSADEKEWVVRADGHSNLRGSVVLYPPQALSDNSPRAFGFEGSIVHVDFAPKGFEVRATSEKTASDAIDATIAQSLEAIPGLRGVRLAGDGIEFRLENPSHAHRMALENVFKAARLLLARFSQTIK